MKIWLTPTLLQEVKNIFEPRYKRIIPDEEAIQIAHNLTATIEEIVKTKWKNKYEKSI